MKRKNIFRISVAFFAMTAFTSCSDQFMHSKQNFDSTTAEAYNYWSGALGRVADVYRVVRFVMKYFSWLALAPKVCHRFVEVMDDDQ